MRSFAKKTFGSTRVGRAIRFPGAVWRRGWDDMFGWSIDCEAGTDVRGQGEGIRYG